MNSCTCDLCLARRFAQQYCYRLSVTTGTPFSAYLDARQKAAPAVKRSLRIQAAWRRLQRLLAG